MIMSKKLLCDLHIHTRKSDGELSIEEVVDIYGKNGFDVIAITDHFLDSESLKNKNIDKKYRKSLLREELNDYYSEIERCKELAMEKYGLLVIPGIEFTANTRGFHILGLDVTEFIDPDQEVEPIVEKIKKQGGIAIAPHPVNGKTSSRHEGNTYLWDRLEKFRGLFDAWEIGNRDDYFSHVGMEGLNYVANSDMHSRKNISSWKTVLTCEKDVESIKEAIRSGNTEVMFYSEYSD